MKNAIFSQITEELEKFTRQIVRDEFLIQIRKQSYESLNDYSFSHQTGRCDSLIGWLQGDKKLSKLHKILTSYGYIICEYDEFKVHFIGNSEELKQIKWLTFTTQLTLLFDFLYTYKFIPKNNSQHNLIKSHFVNKYGENYKNESLRS